MKHCLLAILSFFVFQTIQAQTWKGTTSTNWATASNWDPETVPTATSDVTIPNVANDPVIMAGTAALARSINIQGGALLTLNASSSLTMNGAGGNAIYNEGTLDNSGTISIGATSGCGFNGIETRSIVHNRSSGEIIIDQTGDSGIRVGLAEFGVAQQFGTLNNAGKITIGNTGAIARNGILCRQGSVNNTGGEIKIDRTGEDGIFMFNGTLNNSGKITIGTVATITRDGISSSSTVNNNTGGEIKIDRTSGRGIQNVFGTFNNAAKITIGSVAPINIYGILNFSGNFNNNLGGDIIIDHTNNYGIYNYYDNSTFNNAAKITIGKTTSINSSGIMNETRFNNNTGGEILIDRTTGNGILVQTTSNTTGTAEFKNAGKITIGTTATISGNGIQNRATFNNNAGEIGIDRTSQAGFDNAAGTCNNAAKITIGSIAAITQDGLRNAATFNNNTGGEIKIDQTTQHGLNNTTGTFTNAAKITIGSVTAIAMDGLRNASTFNNNTGGEIVIDRTTQQGLENATGTFTNAAQITIGRVAAIAMDGLRNASTFNNNTGGEIKIDRTTQHGLNHLTGTFTNAAKITIGSVATIAMDGFRNAANFNNNAGGEIRIDRTSQNGLNAVTGTFTNNAQITVGATAAIGTDGIKNATTFNNGACAVLILHDNLNNSSTFTNAGLFKVNTAQAHTNTALTNNGILEYLQNNLIPNVTNNDFIIKAISGECVITSALQKGANLSFTAGNTWYKDPALTMSAATYNQATNTFTVTDLTEGTHTLYFAVTDDVANCTQTVSISVSYDDVTAPTITCPADQTVAASAACSGTVGDRIMQATNVTDNCTTSIAVTQSPLAGTVLNGHNAQQTVTLTANDGHGNTQTCTFTVTLKDVTAPTITCPADQTVAAGANCSGPVGKWADDANASDNCGTLAIGQSVPNTVLNGHNDFEIVTLTANDLHGNSAFCTFRVTLIDITPPTITCPADQTITASSTCGGLIGDRTGQATNLTDNCTASGFITLSQLPAASTVLSGHDDFETITLTANDGNGNTTPCTFKVTLKDVTAPTMTCPADQTVAAGNDCSGMVGDYIEAVIPSLADNCYVIVNQSPAANTILNGHNDFENVTLTADDTHGNTTACTFKVTLKDVTAPTITCPADQTVAADANCSGLVGKWSDDANAGDNCQSLAIGQSSGGITTLNGHNDVQTVTLTANDLHGNTNSCTFTVTLKDVTPPTITCPANQTVAAVNCGGTLGDRTSQATNVTDYCTASSAITLSQSPTANTPLTGHNGEVTVTLTADDNNGNTTTCTFKVVLKDITPPTITCPADQTVAANSSCGGSVGNRTGLATNLTDDCTAPANIVVTQSPAASTVLSGHNDFKTVTLTADDGNGNTTPCTFKVTLKDVTVPVISCPANLVKSSDPNQCGALVAYIVTSTDNCSVASSIPMSGLPGGTMFPIGPTLVVWKATDIAGNTATCSFIVTVNDVQGPAITCPANLIRTTDANQCSAAVAYANPTFSDNCITGATLMRIGGPASGSSFPKGSTPVSWKVTDASGFSATCTFTVTVNDAQAPTITCPASQAKSTDPGQCQAVVTYISPLAADNCAGVSAVLQSGGASGSTFQKGSNTVVWKATDATGLTNTCSFIVTVNDNQAPAITCPANQTQPTDPNLCTAVITYSNPTFTDNCPGGSVSLQSGGASGSAFLKGQTTVVWRATDASGLTKTCTFRITVNDTQAPTITCPPNQAKITDANLCTAVATYTNATFTDNCMGGSVVKLSGLNSGSAFPKGTNNVIFKATDASGNQSLCSFSITVTDAQLPVINCPSNIAVTAAAGECRATATYATPTATDNCGILSNFLLSGLASGSVYPQGVTTNVWKATDDGGLTATCAFTVTVNCGTSPVTMNDEPGTMNEQRSEHASFIVHRLSFTLAPNPATTEVQISVNGLKQGGAVLTVLDVQGRAVMQQKISAEQILVALNCTDGWEAGVYMLVLQSDTETVAKRLVVVKP